MDSEDKVSWREMISEEMDVHGETWANVVSCTITDAELDRRFDAGPGGIEGAPFALWTTGRVYFPACYDGVEWVASVPRFPRGEVVKHVGG